MDILYSILLELSNSKPVIFYVNSLLKYFDTGKPKEPIFIYLNFPMTNIYVYKLQEMVQRE